MVYVFDSSFVCALIIPDEKNQLVNKMYEKIENQDIKYAPCMFWYETANIFMNLVRRKRYTSDEVKQFFPQLTAFQLICDSETGTGYSQKLLRLCIDYNLSSYDATYLELAERKKAVLCTLDDGLRAAARKHGIAVLQ